MQTSRAWGTALGFCTRDGLLSHALPSQARLRRQDVGLKPHLEQPDVRRPCGEAADSDSRPSSGSPHAPFPSPLLGPACVLSPPPTARRPSREAPLPRALEDFSLAPKCASEPGRVCTCVFTERGPSTGSAASDGGRLASLSPLRAETIQGLLGLGSPGGGEEPFHPAQACVTGHR